MKGIGSFEGAGFYYDIPPEERRDRDQALPEIEELNLQSNEVKKEETKLETARLEKRLIGQILQEHVPPNLFIITADKVKTLLLLTGLNSDELMAELVPIAKERARPSISQYKVGAVGLGGSGALYLGVNLEFQGFQLNQTVHGEQFVAALARQQGETTLAKIALSAEPCGHCRQFLNELEEESNLQILTPENEPTTLSSLLPKNFGPKNLGIKGGMLANQNSFKDEIYDYSLSRGGIVHFMSPYGKSLTEAAASSYAPYTKSLAAVTLETEDKTFFGGSYLENAAYNPSLPPLQAALINLVAAGRSYEDIRGVFLMEKKFAAIQHALISEAIVKSIAPGAVFRLVQI